MSFFKYLLLAVVHGILEFLPVSSSTHLTALEKWLDFNNPFFDKLLGLATGISVLIFFRKRIMQLLYGLVHQSPEAWQYAVYVIVGCIPAAINFFTMYKPAKKYLDDDLSAICGLMVVTGIVLLSTRKLNETWNPESHCIAKAILIGIAQSLALFPGISRSGMTISTGRWLHLPWLTSLEFSFLMSVPLVFGDAVLGFKDFKAINATELLMQITAAVIAGVIGYFALGILKKIIEKQRFWLFSLYLIPVGIAAGIYFLCK